MKSRESLQYFENLYSNNEIGAVIKSLPTKKNTGCDGFIAEFYQTFKEELIPLFLRLFQEIKIEGTLQTHSMNPALYSFQIQY
jgi:hypothetical protein